MLGAFAVLSFVVSSVAAQKSSLSIPLHKKGSPLSNNGVVNLSALAKEHARVLGKYRKDSVARQARPRSNSRVYGKRQNEPLTPDPDQTAFFGELSVGTPPQTFSVLFDTGSSDFWVAGSGCSSGCDGLTRYDPAASSTSADAGRDAQIQYGDGTSVSGRVYSDTISMAGITVTNQALISVNQITGGSTPNTINGLLGLGFRSISVTESTNFVETAFNQGHITSPVFSLSLKDPSAELYIGGDNPAKYSGEFTCAPVSEQGFWKVQGQAGPDPSSSPYTGLMIIDSGTTLILGDSTSVQAFYAGVPGAEACSSCGAGFYTVPCDQIPTPVFTFEDRAFTIPAEDFNVGQESAGSTKCVTALTSGDAPDAWVVGLPLLKNVYTKFDFGNVNVCFATPA